MQDEYIFNLEKREDKRYYIRTKVLLKSLL